MSDAGFDPTRLDGSKRPSPVVAQILAPDVGVRARGFTEIKVVGLGGAGLNTIDRMIDTGVSGIDFIAMNTDVQALERCQARTRVQLGERLTRGRGAGGDPRIGYRAAELAREAMVEALAGADMVFITAGLGGGTGTGAAIIAAEVARAAGALTVGVVTLPFVFEGQRRRTAAQDGLLELQKRVDSLIVVANDRLLRVASPGTGIGDSFALADETLRQGIHGIADLVLTPGLINLDFADVKSIMQKAGPALMAMGTGRGENRAYVAVEGALTSPLLDTPVSGARGILLNVTGGPDLALHEVNTIAARIGEVADPECNLIFGAVIHPRLGDEVRVTVIAAGFSPA